VNTADWEVLRQTNIDGFFHLTKATLPLLEQQRCDRESRGLEMLK
jgi:NADP-dependent 3-hydroxy acid dehydrogenase YdfG